MSLQAHTATTASADRADRVTLPELPDQLHDRLLNIAARYDVTLDELAEFIFRDPAVCKVLIDGRTLRALTGPDTYTGSVPAFIPCRNGGNCPEAFRFREVWRCGCPRDSRLHDVGP